MPWGAVAAVGGALIGANATSKAADTQAASADRATQLQSDMFDKQMAMQKPFMDAGVSANNRLQQLLGLTPGGADNGSLMKDFTPSDLTSDPGYQWRLQQGQQGLDNSAAARGNLLSGAALKSAMDYNQGAASQEYQNAFNRFQVNRSNKLNPLQAMAGQGQSAANQTSGYAGQYGQAAGNNMMSAGNARASGYIGGANALTGALGQGFNMYQQNSLMNRLFPTGTGTGSGGMTPITTPEQVNAMGGGF